MNTEPEWSKPFPLRNHAKKLLFRIAFTPCIFSTWLRKINT